jgi:hypothetical protein
VSDSDEDPQGPENPAGPGGIDAPAPPGGPQRADAPSGGASPGTPAAPPPGTAPGGAAHEGGADGRQRAQEVDPPAPEADRPDQRDPQAAEQRVNAQTAQDQPSDGSGGE